MKIEKKGWGCSGEGEPYPGMPCLLPGAQTPDEDCAVLEGRGFIFFPREYHHRWSSTTIHSKAISGWNFAVLINLCKFKNWIFCNDVNIYLFN